MRSKPRTEYRVLPIALVTLVAVLSGCREPTWQDSLAPVTDVRAFTQYPCDTQESVSAAITISALTGDVIRVTDSTYVEDVRAPEDIDQFLVSGPYLAANELHDCQRLVIAGSSGLDLGPLTGLHVNRALLEGLNSESRPGVVAEIFNHGGEEYRPLGIQPGWNCLWVEPGPSADGVGWKAAVRQPGENQTCMTTVFDPLPATALDVHRLQHGGSVYPSTGRWMWDGADSVQSQYIGIRCGDGWCELGPRGFTPTAAIADSSEVPGWFDEQYISYPGPGGPLQLSGIWARLEPADSIWLTDDPSVFETPRGVHVMTIVFQGEDSTGPGRTAYHNKLGLPPGLDRHEIRMRTRNVSGTYEWEAKSPGSGWTRISRLPYTHGVTGSVRWLWLYDDEGGWLPCDRGCCPVDQWRGGDGGGRRNPGPPRPTLPGPVLRHPQSPPPLRTRAAVCWAPDRSSTGLRQPMIRTLALPSLCAAFLVTAAACARTPAPRSAASAAAAAPGPRIEWGLVMHGGAGTITRASMTPELETEYRAKMTEALRAGHAVLRDGGSSLDAVVAAIVVLEDSPLFNAGKGAVFTAEGTNSLDASIMYGPTLAAGAVAGVETVKNPIRLARAVMEASPHVMLSGEGAEAFAAEQGIERVDPEYFYTERRWRALQRAREEERGGGEGSASVSPGESVNRARFGTVGVIALDREGRIAAGTSTGGTTNKKWGRIGDSPIIGAGTYASDRCGISATGWGEHFIRNVVAYDICARAAYRDIPLLESARQMIHEQLEAQEPETGGIVGLDAAGNVVMTFNTPGMYRGYIDADGRVETAIYR